MRIHDNGLLFWATLYIFIGLHLHRCISLITANKVYSHCQRTKSLPIFLYNRHNLAIKFSYSLYTKQSTISTEVIASVKWLILSCRPHDNYIPYTGDNPVIDDC